MAQDGVVAIFHKQYRTYIGLDNKNTGLCTIQSTLNDTGKPDHRKPQRMLNFYRKHQINEG